MQDTGHHPDVGERAAQVSPPLCRALLPRIVVPRARLVALHLVHLPRRRRLVQRPIHQRLADAHPRLPLPPKAQRHSRQRA